MCYVCNEINHLHKLSVPIKMIIISTKKLFTLTVLSSIFFSTDAQNTSIDFEKYNPPSTLVVPAHPVTHAKYPFIDVHNHQWNMPTQDINALLRSMDSLNMKVMVNISGRGYQNTNGFLDVKDSFYFKNSIKNIGAARTNRIILFTNISFIGFGTDGWLKNAVQQLEADIRNGACGLKIYKDLGLDYKDNKGKRIRIDDPRLEPIWDVCEKNDIPVIIHSADPESFWDSLNYDNERLLELKLNPRRARLGKEPATWEEVINEQHILFLTHPNITFIAAHMGWMANDLGSLGKLLDEMPNVNVEIAAVIAELGRQPKNARKFFEKYQDRIMMGKDSWVPEEYGTYFRLLESDDEYFPYHKKYHAFWRMYGLDLSDDILRKVYYKNALRIIPGIDRTLFPD